MKTSTLLSSLVALALVVGPVLPIVNAAEMQDKVCPRVVKRFSNDDKMWERVNERIQGRFGFVCERLNASVQQSSVPSVQPSQKASSSQKNVKQECVESDWSCGDWSECTAKGYKERTCDVSRQCFIGTKKPITRQTCTFSNDLQIEMKENLDKWSALRDEMIKAGKDLIPQGDAGKEGIKRIAIVETQHLILFNKYVEIYNKYIRFTPDQLKMWKALGKEAGISKSDIVKIEEEMEKLEKIFRAIPVLWY